MSSDTDLVALTQNVERMVDLAAMLGEHDWAKQAKAGLESLQRSLAAEGKAGQQ